MARLPVVVSSLSSTTISTSSSNTKNNNRSIVSNIFFIAFSILIGVTLVASLAIGIFTLWIDEGEDRTTTIVSAGAIKGAADTVVSYISAQKIQKQFSEIIIPQRIMEINSLQESIPYYPPFTAIPNGEQLAADVRNGKNPTLGGIVHILQMFLRDLRDANHVHVNVTNDRNGEDIVRATYFDLAKKHLLPFDEPYRGRTIFPIRKDDTIFMSLAAFREHLLYETLSGAFEHAAEPNKLYVGVVMQNCFGIDDRTGETYGCKTGAQVIGKDKNGYDMTKVSDAPPDSNGVEKFCALDSVYKKYCDAGQIRVLSVHEQEALGPAVARYYASKLWGGETYYLQADSHLQFTDKWDEHYKNEIKATSNYPKSVLSMYPPGFGGLAYSDTPGTRLCTCEFSDSPVEDHIIRISNGMSYPGNKVYPKPTQIPFIAAGFFFAYAEFLKDVPFDPFLPWCFMGEEIALSMRAWTSGWNIYAPRKNWIAHQYRPGRMGLPKFWGSVGRTFKRGIGFSNRLQTQVVKRVKYLVGYPDITNDALKQTGLEHVLTELEHYGLGTVRTRAEYIKLTGINFDKKECPTIRWCNHGELD